MEQKLNFIVALIQGHWENQVLKKFLEMKHAEIGIQLTQILIILGKVIKSQEIQT